MADGQKSDQAEARMANDGGCGEPTASAFFEDSGDLGVDAVSCGSVGPTPGQNRDLLDKEVKRGDVMFTTLGDRNDCKPECMMFTHDVVLSASEFDRELEHNVKVWIEKNIDFEVGKQKHYLKVKLMQNLGSDSGAYTKGLQEARTAARNIVLLVTKNSLKDKRQESINHLTWSLENDSHYSIIVLTHDLNDSDFESENFSLAAARYIRYEPDTDHFIHNFKDRLTRSVCERLHYDAFRENCIQERKGNQLHYSQNHVHVQADAVVDPRAVTCTVPKHIASVSDGADQQSARNYQGNSESRNNHQESTGIAVSANQNLSAPNKMQSDHSSRMETPPPPSHSQTAQKAEGFSELTLPSNVVGDGFYSPRSHDALTRHGAESTKTEIKTETPKIGRNMESVPGENSSPYDGSVSAHTRKEQENGPPKSSSTVAANETKSWSETKTHSDGQAGFSGSGEEKAVAAESMANAIESDRNETNTRKDGTRNEDTRVSEIDDHKSNTSSRTADLNNMSSLEEEHDDDRSQTAENASRNQTAENASRNQTAENASRNQTAENASRNQTAENASRNQTAENASRNQTAENASRSQTAENASRNQTAENASRNQTAENASRNQTAENASRNQTAENASRNQTAENASRNQTAENASRNQTAENASRNQTAENASRSQTAENASRNQTAENASMSHANVTYKELPQSVAGNTGGAREKTFRPVSPKVIRERNRGRSSHVAQDSNTSAPNSKEKETTHKGKDKSSDQDLQPDSEVFRDDHSSMQPEDKKHATVKESDQKDTSPLKTVHQDTQAYGDTKELHGQDQKHHSARPSSEKGSQVREHLESQYRLKTSSTYTNDSSDWRSQSANGSLPLERYDSVTRMEDLKVENVSIMSELSEKQHSSVSHVKQHYSASNEGLSLEEPALPVSPSGESAQGTTAKGKMPIQESGQDKKGIFDVEYCVGQSSPVSFIPYMDDITSTSCDHDLKLRLRDPEEATGDPAPDSKDQSTSDSSDHIKDPLPDTKQAPQSNSHLNGTDAKDSKEEAAKIKMKDTTIITHQGTSNVHTGVHKAGTVAVGTTTINNNYYIGDPSPNPAGASRYPAVIPPRIVSTAPSPSIPPQSYQPEAERGGDEDDEATTMKMIRRRSSLKEDADTEKEKGDKKKKKLFKLSKWLCFGSDKTYQKPKRK